MKRKPFFSGVRILLSETLDASLLPHPYGKKMLFSSTTLVYSLLEAINCFIPSKPTFTISITRAAKMKMGVQHLK